MTENILAFINQEMLEAGVNYEYGTYSGKLTYPYWVGEHSERGPRDEGGMREHSFILTGFTNGSALSLMPQAKEIEDALDHRRAILPDGEGIALFFESAMKVPTVSEHLHSIQITFEIKEWRSRNGRS